MFAGETWCSRQVDYLHIQVWHLCATVLSVFKPIEWGLSGMRTFWFEFWSENKDFLVRVLVRLRQRTSNFLVRFHHSFQNGRVEQEVGLLSVFRKGTSSLRLPTTVCKVADSSRPQLKRFDYVRYTKGTNVVSLREYEKNERIPNFMKELWKKALKTRLPWTKSTTQHDLDITTPHNSDS